MATPHRNLQRIGAGLALLIVAAVSSGCAARAEYVYEDEPVYYRRGPVYSAPPPPVVVYREHDHYHGRPAYRAPASRARVGVYSAPLVHRPPPAHHEHRHEGRHDRDRDDRRHHR